MRFEVRKTLRVPVPEPARVNEAAGRAPRSLERWIQRPENVMEVVFSKEGVIPQESGEDAKCASALKAAAEKSRAALLDDIADESLKKKAQLLADAAIAGEKVKKITLKEEASDKDSACSSAFTKADMKSTDGACVAKASASGRRRLSATTSKTSIAVARLRSTVDVAQRRRRAPEDRYSSARML